MSRQCKALEKKYLQGRSIEPIRLCRGMSVKDLIEVYSGMGFKARRLAESCEVYANMLKADATVCLTLAGAMTPIEMSADHVLELGLAAMVPRHAQEALEVFRR